MIAATLGMSLRYIKILMVLMVGLFSLADEL